MISILLVTSLVEYFAKIKTSMLEVDPLWEEERGGKKPETQEI